LVQGEAQWYDGFGRQQLIGAVTMAAVAATSELGAILFGAESPLLDVLLESMPLTVVVADADGTILRVSRFSCELSGWEAHELEGLTLSQYLATVKPSDKVGRVLKKEEVPLVRALKGEHVTAYEGSFLHRNGKQVHCGCNAAPLTRSDGRVIGAISALNDLRTYQALETALYVQERRLLALRDGLIGQIIMSERQMENRPI
jgi:PAS domain S-box-containing protein